MVKDNNTWREQTQWVREGAYRTELGEMGEPLYLTSAFAYETAEIAEARFDGSNPGYAYSRQTNPTVEMFERRMVALEAGDRADNFIGRATATGMAAMSAALMASLKAGDHVVAAKAMFGSCRWLVDVQLPRFGIETTVVDSTDVAAWKAAIKPNTKLFFLETPANPTLEIADIRAIADIAHAHGAKLAVDNVFATPVLQKPLALGADIVAYSATKHIDGQGRVLGGIVIADKEFDEEHLYAWYRHTGVAMSPFNAWVLLKGLETLSLRVGAMCDNAEKVAALLADRVADTRYPFMDSFKQHALARAQMRRGGTMVTTIMPGGKEQAFEFLNALRLVDISNNLGDSRSIATHCWTTTHKALDEATRLELGITPGLLRLSIGLEDGDDIVDDISQALRTAGL